MDRAFTIIELLVVVVIISILLSAVLVVSTSVIDAAKSRNTRAVLQLVSEAVEEFQREQRANPTITRAVQGGVAYLDRYGDRRRDIRYPPDELEVFTPLGIPGSGINGKSLGVGGAVIVPTPSRPWGAMRFFRDGTEEDALEHRDQAAMIVAIETLGDASAALLAKIPQDNRRAILDPATELPRLFLDRPGADGTRDEEFGPGDLEIRYIVDAWGVPISYFAQRERDPDDPQVASTNHPDWREASTAFIRLNAGQPVIMSYGPDGEEQLTQEWMVSAGAGEEPPASLVDDFADDGRINHPLNQDNVYVDEALADKLAQGVPQ